MSLTIELKVDVMMWEWVWFGTAITVIIAVVSTVGAISFIINYVGTGKKLGAILWGTVSVLSLVGMGFGLGSLTYTYFN